VVEGIQPIDLGRCAEPLQSVDEGGSHGDGLDDEQHDSRHTGSEYQADGRFRLHAYGTRVAENTPGRSGPL
jgi:hypothetical protein